MIKANFIPPKNDQRTDPKWDWTGIRIVGNSKCQGNANEDLLKSIGMEFNIIEFEKLNTFNYYAIFFAFLEKFDPDLVTRQEMMDWRNHASCLQFYVTANKLPVQIVCYSSIGDRARPNDLVKIKKFNGSAKFLSDLIIKTKRPTSVGTLVLPSGHWRRFHGTDEHNEVFEENDPFGKAPYKSQQDKINNVHLTKWEDLEKQKIRRIISIEDLS